MQSNSKKDSPCIMADVPDFIDQFEHELLIGTAGHFCKKTRGTKGYDMLIDFLIAGHQEDATHCNSLWQVEALVDRLNCLAVR